MRSTQADLLQMFDHEFEVFAIERFKTEKMSKFHALYKIRLIKSIINSKVMSVIVSFSCFRLDHD